MISLFFKVYTSSIYIYNKKKDRGVREVMSFLPASGISQNRAYEISSKKTLYEQHTGNALPVKGYSEMLYSRYFLSLNKIGK
ncbi:hypothetical protein DW888_17960 [Bacteroides nordii]|uniref:Uncharacterized protein n=1 Tax=Bacteroides nordii TaxID=291645 RepID=A0A413VCZ1_9BACE|nr:hypothetical protein DW888_17960 [Bacteroides nordii]